MTQLYTATDVKKVRESLLKEQEGLCKLTGLEIPIKQACLDHDHKSNFVRGVLHRQSNAALGKAENIFTRYLSYWYPGTLSDFLRQAADYLEEEHPRDYLHPGWIKSVKTRFNKLNSKQKDSVLQLLNQPKGRNDVERKKIFAKAILDRLVSYETIVEYITKAN